MLLFFFLGVDTLSHLSPNWWFGFGLDVQKYLPRLVSQVLGPVQSRKPPNRRKLIFTMAEEGTPNMFVLLSFSGAQFSTRKVSRRSIPKEPFPNDVKILFVQVPFGFSLEPGSKQGTGIPGIPQ